MRLIYGAEAAASAPHDFGGGITVTCRPLDAIAVEQARASAAEIMVSLKKSGELTADLGILPEDFARVIAESPFGFTRWIQAIYFAKAMFVSWSGQLPVPLKGKQTKPRFADMSKVDLDLANIAVFVRDPARLQLVMSLALGSEMQLSAEGEA
ncbi:MAG: hypothetical protein QNI84_07940 [Henriciella sp.]|nr:hypothetical protein [Henriciella sp.]